MSLVPPPVSCHQPWAAGWAPLPQQAFLESKDQKRGSKSRFLPLCPLSSFCTTLREQAALLPPSLCTATDPCLSGCWTPAVSHSPGLAASHRAVQGTEAWSRAMQPQGWATSLPCAFKLPPKSSFTDVFEGCRGRRGSCGDMDGVCLEKGSGLSPWPQLLAPLFRMNALISSLSLTHEFRTAEKFLLPTRSCGWQGAWWQDDWACQGWHCCVQLFTSPQCLCSSVGLLTSLLGLSVQTHLGCGLSRWALSWPHQLVGWPLGTMPSQKQVIREQIVLWCLESPLVTPKPLFDFSSGNKARNRRWSAPRIDPRCNNAGFRPWKMR